MIYLTLYCVLNAVFDFTFSDWQIDAFGIALVHSIFNVATVVLLFPFSKHIEKLAYLIIKDKTEGTAEDEVYSFVDVRLLSTPSVAIRECNSKCKKSI